MRLLLVSLVHPSGLCSSGNGPDSQQMSRLSETRHLCLLVPLIVPAGGLKNVYLVPKDKWTVGDVVEPLMTTKRMPLLSPLLQNSERNAS